MPMSRHKQAKALARHKRLVRARNIRNRSYRLYDI